MAKDCRKECENTKSSFRNAIVDFFYDEYFRKEKGHEYTDEEIVMSVNGEDIEDCLECMRSVLYMHFGTIKEGSKGRKNEI